MLINIHLYVTNTCKSFLDTSVHPQIEVGYSMFHFAHKFHRRIEIKFENVYVRALAEVAKCVLPIKLLVYCKCQCTSRHLTFHTDPRRKGAHFKDTYPFTAFHIFLAETSSTSTTFCRADQRQMESWTRENILCSVKRQRGVNKRVALQRAVPEETAKRC